ncbi:hypothetical protein AB0B74_10145 [Micromonospora parva]|uniref:hypothetical protein n=1 Tax=Micromonospora parva TaxID=1464048 RepID=UPI0033FD67DE
MPLGTMLGGPLVGAIGARPTLLLCAVAIVVLGLAAAGFAHSRRSLRTPDGPTVTEISAPRELVVPGSDNAEHV